MAYKPGLVDAEDSEVRLTKAKIDTIEKYWTDSQARIEITRKAIAESHKRELASMERDYQKARQKIENTIDDTKQAISDAKKALREVTRKSDFDPAEKAQATKAVKDLEAMLRKQMRDRKAEEDKYNKALASDKKEQEAELYKIQLLRYQNLSKVASISQRREYEEEISRIAAVQQAELEAEDVVTKKRINHLDYLYKKFRKQAKEKEKEAVALGDTAAGKAAAREAKQLYAQADKISKERASLSTRHKTIESDINKLLGEQADAKMRAARWQGLLNKRLAASLTIEENLNQVRNKQLEAQQRLQDLKQDKAERFRAIDEDSSLSSKQKEEKKAGVRRELDPQIKKAGDDSKNLRETAEAFQSALMEGMRNVLTSSEFTGMLTQRRAETQEELKKLRIDLEAKKQLGAPKEQLEIIEKNIRRKEVDLEQTEQELGLDRLRGRLKEIPKDQSTIKTALWDGPRNIHRLYGDNRTVEQRFKDRAQAAKDSKDNFSGIFSGVKSAGDFVKALKDFTKAVGTSAKDIRNAGKNNNSFRKTFEGSKEGFNAWFSPENLSRLKSQDQEANSQFGENFAKNISDSVGQALSNVGAMITKAVNQIDSDIGSFYEHQAHVEARLQGSEASYQKAIEMVTSNVGASGYVSQKAIIENIIKASDAGIAYNLEMRAFLATIADNIANTFEALDQTLLRIVRLQQADTTAARLGMEASLTKFFNSMYSDTAYLTTMYDTISSSIVEANSQMSRDQSIEFEYQVQKWLGSLYEVGMSDAALNKIAEGLNYLATGNVSALNSNNELQTLLALSSQKAGLDYASLLTNSLTGSDTNKLLKAMVEYLKEIAESSADNKVVESAWANTVFGMNLSDFRAVTNLSSSDVNSIAGSSLNYSSAMGELNNQLTQITERIHLSQVLDTAIENALATSATTIGNNIGLYATWKVLNIIEDLTGGIAIPAVSILGNMVDLHATVTGLAKAGIAGLSLMGSLIASVPSMSDSGPFDFGKWGYQEYTSRGSVQPSVAGGISTGVSSSQEMSPSLNASGADIKKTTLNTGADDAEEDSKIVNKNSPKTEHSFDDLYDAFFTDHEEIYIYSEQLLEIIDINSRIATTSGNIAITSGNILTHMDSGVISITGKQDETIAAIRAIKFDSNPIIAAIEAAASSVTSAVGAISSSIDSLGSTIASSLTTAGEAEDGTDGENNDVPGYASGTLNAKRGKALVGEKGPELITLAGGERIYNNKETEAILRNENQVLNHILDRSEIISAYASGTLNAERGEALVGEEGPELISIMNSESTNSLTNKKLISRQKLLLESLIYSTNYLEEDLISNLISNLISSDSNSSQIAGSGKVNNFNKAGNVLSILNNFKTNSNLTTVNKISELETNLITLCDSIEQMTSNINEQNNKLVGQGADDKLEVKVSEIENGVMKALHQMIEQRVYEAVLKAVMRVFSGNNENNNTGEPEETVLSVLKQLRDNPKDVRVTNDNFDSVLMNMLFNANY